MRPGIIVPAIAMALLSGTAGTVGADEAKRGFETMAQPSDPPDACRAPRPPRDLAETAYIRNGYRAILRIMAAEKWLETGSCECSMNAIEWEDVIVRSEVFVTSENPRLPFDVVALQKRAAEMETERASACGAE